MTERIQIVVEVEPATDGLLAGLAEYTAICSGRRDLWDKFKFEKVNATALEDQIRREVLKGTNGRVRDMHDLPELILVQYMSSPGGGRIRGVVNMEDDGYNGSLMVETGEGAYYFPDDEKTVKYTVVKNPLYVSKKKKKL